MKIKLFLLSISILLMMGCNAFEGMDSKESDEEVYEFQLEQDMRNGDYSKVVEAVTEKIQNDSILKSIDKAVDTTTVLSTEGAISKTTQLINDVVEAKKVVESIATTTNVAVKAEIENYFKVNDTDTVKFDITKITTEQAVQVKIQTEIKEITKEVKNTLKTNPTKAVEYVNLKTKEADARLGTSNLKVSDVVDKMDSKGDLKISDIIPKDLNKKELETAVDSYMKSLPPDTESREKLIKANPELKQQYQSAGIAMTVSSGNSLLEKFEKKDNDDKVTLYTTTELESLSNFEEIKESWVLDKSRIITELQTGIFLMNMDDTLDEKDKKDMIKNGNDIIQAVIKLDFDNPNWDKAYGELKDKMDEKKDEKKEEIK